MSANAPAIAATALGLLWAAPEGTRSPDGRQQPFKKGCFHLALDTNAIILPIALPGMVAAFILSLVLTWNEYFFAALLTSTHANTLPVMVASQTGSQGISWWSMAALAWAAILPLIVIGVVLERYIIKGMAAGAVK